MDLARDPRILNIVEIALGPVQQFFLGYLLVNVGAIMFFLFFNRWPLRVVHWVTLVMSFIDGLVVSALVVITAGIPRKPGMSRSDVLETNAAIIDGIVDDVLCHAPRASILVVSNPVDVLTWRVWQRTGWPRERVMGQAGVLDASRMATFIAMETGFSSRDITTIVLGGHGDSMVPLPRFCTINGIPVSHFVSEERIRDIIQRTRDGGAEILALRKNSSAYDAPGASVATMVDAISHNRRRLLPCVAILQGEYGQDAIAMGVPCVLGQSGLERVVELEFTEEEQRWFDGSARAVAADIDRLKALTGN
ncbi:MAG: malate dehydrogenase [Gammaproteobacteria bacterium]|nr:MAG: malate dehydrogenase [Gammaproteobacteria bacterium]